MRMWLVLVLVVLAGAPAAAAADWHNALFDQVATQTAGHPVSVYCENDWAEWDAWGMAAASGFSNASAAVVYVNPRQCETLQALANHEDVGTYYAASALLTLVHESVHQRGITDEGVTDCTAIPLVPGVATQFFGVQATVPEMTMSSRRMKIGKRRYTTVPTLVTSQVANPWLSRLAADVERWHKAKPPEYQGGC